jgi:hypothetical protein
MIPTKLYKYQPYNVQTLDNLKNRRLWFSKPVRFNDPFDCAINYAIDKMNSKDWKVLYRKSKTLWENDEDGTHKDRIKEYFSDDVPGELFKDEYAKGLKEQIKLAIEKEIHDKGIGCFSETASNILMWSHYADGHKGFCLEYDTSFKPFLYAEPVNYSISFPRLNPRNDSLDLLPNLALTKAIGWAYEREWRVFHEKGDSHYQLDFKALTGIFFGSVMPKEHKEIISLILYGSPTKLYDTRVSETKFEIESAQIVYKPYNYSKNTA